MCHQQLRMIVGGALPRESGKVLHILKPRLSGELHWSRMRVRESNLVGYG